MGVSEMMMVRPQRRFLFTLLVASASTTVYGAADLSCSDADNVLGCDEGQWCASGLCVACPLGKTSFNRYDRDGNKQFGPNSYSDCKPCRLGEAGSLEGQVNGPKFAKCKTCGPKTSGVQAAGRVSNGLGSPECVSCAAGQYAQQLTPEICGGKELSQATCVGCKESDVSKGGTDTCNPQGYYQCGACAPGLVTYQWENDLVKGEGNITEDQDKCHSDCPAGSYQRGSECIHCPPGKYQEKSKSTSCDTCQSGKVSTVVGSTTQSTCEWGPMCRQDANVTCAQGAPGFFRSNCRACGKCMAGGSYCSDGRLKLCEAGTFSIDLVQGGKWNKNHGHASCEKCPTGKFSDVGSSNCTNDCPPGMFLENDGSGAYICKQCSNNQYNPHVNARSCQVCPPGKFAEYVPQDDHKPYTGEWWQRLIVSGATTCSTCSGGTSTAQHKAYYNGNCSYCPNGTTMFTYSRSQVFDSRINTWSPEFRWRSSWTYGPQCLPCAPGTFSNFSTVRHYSCGQGGAVSTGWAAKTPGSSQSPYVNYETSRAKCNWYTYGAVSGGACMKCPPGQVSTNYNRAGDGPAGHFVHATTGSALYYVAGTQCAECPEGTFPDYDKSKCVNGAGIVALLFIIQVLFCVGDIASLVHRCEIQVCAKNVPITLIISAVWIVVTIISVTAGNVSAPAQAAVAIYGFVLVFLIPCVATIVKGFNQPTFKLDDNQNELSIPPPQVEQDAPAQIVSA